MTNATYCLAVKFLTWVWEWSVTCRILASSSKVFTYRHRLETPLTTQGHAVEARKKELDPKPKT